MRMSEIRERARSQGIEHIGIDVANRLLAGSLPRLIKNEQSRKVLTCRFLDGMTRDETAKTLGLVSGYIGTNERLSLERIYTRGPLEPMPDYRHKFDALIAAVMELDDATRDRILSRAKELEAEVQEDDE